MKILSTTMLVLAATMSLVSCATGGGVATSTRDRNIASAQGFLDDLLLHGEPDRAKARVAPNFEFRYMGRPDVPELARLTEPFDREAYFGEFLALVADVLPNGIVLTTTHVVADDRAVALLMDGDAEGRFGEYDNRYVFYFEFENGLISRLYEYNSDLLAMRSLWGYRLVAPE